MRERFSLSRLNCAGIGRAPEKLTTGTVSKAQKFHTNNALPRLADACADAPMTLQPFLGALLRRLLTTLHLAQQVTSVLLLRSRSGLEAVADDLHAVGHRHRSISEGTGGDEEELATHRRP